MSRILQISFLEGANRIIIKSNYIYDITPNVSINYPSPKTGEGDIIIVF